MLHQAPRFITPSLELESPPLISLLVILQDQEQLELMANFQLVIHLQMISLQKEQKQLL